MTDRRIDGSADRPSDDPPSRRTTLPTPGRLLCVDPGTRRIGLALSDPTQTLAQPLATLTRRTGRRFPMAALRPLLDEHRPVGLVVGLPLEPSGAEGSAAREARSAGELLARTTGLPVAYWDERMSTARVARAAGHARERAMRTEGGVDQLAATVILQGFLDRRRAS